MWKLWECVQNTVDEEISWRRLWFGTEASS